MSEQIAYPPGNLLISKEKSSRSTPEKDYLRKMLTQRIAEFIQENLGSWDAPRIKDNEITGNVGIKTPAGRKMQVEAALRGEQIGSERAFIEQTREAISIPTLRIQLIMEASPTIIALQRMQQQAFDLLAVFSGIEIPQINSLLTSVRFDALDKRVQFVAVTKNGSYGWRLDKKALTPLDLEQEYRNALLATILERVGGSSRPKLIGAPSKTDRALFDIKNNKETGVLDVPIVASAVSWTSYPNDFIYISLQDLGLKLLNGGKQAKQ